MSTSLKQKIAALSRDERAEIKKSFYLCPMLNPLTFYRTKPGATWDLLVKEFGDPYSEEEPKETKKYKKPNDESKNEPVIENNVDIFDFKKYKAEHKLMKNYFTDLELVLRTALFIDYKYNYLDPKNNTVFEEQIESKKKKHRREYITSVLNAFEPLYLVTQWLRHFNPKAIKKNTNYPEEVIEKYKGHLDGMFNRMYKARVDTEWDEKAKLWFS